MPMYIRYVLLLSKMLRRLILASVLLGLCYVVTSAPVVRPRMQRTQSIGKFWDQDIVPSRDTLYKDLLIGNKLRMLARLHQNGEGADDPDEGPVGEGNDGGEDDSTDRMKARLRRIRPSLRTASI